MISPLKVAHNVTNVNEEVPYTTMKLQDYRSRLKWCFGSGVTVGAVGICAIALQIAPAIKTADANAATTATTVLSATHDTTTTVPK